MSATTHLPAVVTEAGGALVSVLSWTQYTELSPQVTYALGRLVGEHPDLNTEQRVDLLADMAHHHGSSFDAEFLELLEEYTPELVHLAIDTLYECAYRDRQGGKMADLEGLAKFIQAAGEYGRELTTVHGVSVLLERLGGLEVVVEYSLTEIEQALDGLDEADSRGGYVEELI